MGPDLRLQQRVLDRFELVSGIGDPDQGTACVMSLVAHLAGEGRTDRPGCASPLVRAFAIPINDRMPPEARRRLKPFVPRLIGTNDGLDGTRAEVLRRALVEVVLPRASGECPASSPRGPVSRLAGPFRRLRVRLLRGILLRHIARLLEEAERGGSGPGQAAELASAAGHLLALRARDAWDAREAEWYWNQAIGLLDRLCEVGAQARQAAPGVPAAGPAPRLEAAP
ncbi:hypothetical protein GCM10009416_50830 [Craurococcus roseus]|uniref:Uncharacterized protein n=1 Tax=Craurococcus roseus TaxID=77585 RepID=A0ABP3RC90_9PROT